MALTFEPLNHDEPAVRAKIFAFVAPQEPYGLFLLGNLNAQVPGTHFYGLREGAAWRVIGAHYEGPRSIVPFALPGTEPALLGEFGREISSRHPDFDWLLGMDSTARPMLDVLVSRGYAVLNDPVQVFMEMRGLPAVQPHEEFAKLARPGDLEATVRLLRYLRGQTDDGSPITAGERAQFEINKDRMVLEREGRVVSTAASNGVGIAACQVLGVATAPEERGKGYAGATVAALMRHMAKQGAKHTILFTRHDNRPAIRCYEKLGYKITGDYLLAKLKGPAGR
ncbi:MAG TPA: GNAT family N-acetyltransferase [Planctomycetota bacterium]|nr:GNAT family N-acetyltransferase [Planctomycetota bacterium]